MESTIRLHRTGLVVFGSKVLSIFTGMLFLIMVTGWLAPQRFGLWEVILSLVAFASYPAGWLGFWATREVARGNLLGKTAILLNLALSSGGVAAFFLFTAFSYTRFNASFSPFILAILMVPMAYWNQAANAVAAGYRPEALGYSLLFSEAGKLAVAYPAFFIFRLEIQGAILALLASSLVQAVVTTVLVRGALTDHPAFDVGKRWLSNSWVPAFYTIGGTVALGDTVAAAAVTGSTLVTGYYQAAFQVGTLVSYAAFLSLALYPLLLRGRSDDVPNATIDFVLMFGIPMAAGAAVLAPRLLSVLSSAYVASGSDVSLALGILGGVGLVTAIAAVLDNILIGKERADTGAGMGYRSYLKSHFFFVSIVNLGYAVAYIVSVILSVGLGRASGLSISTVVALWAASQLGLLLVALVVKLRRLKGVARLTLPPSLARYLLASLVMVAVVYLLSGIFPTGAADRLVDAERVAVIVTAGTGVYFGLLLAIDARTRRLAGAFYRNFIGRPPAP